VDEIIGPDPAGTPMQDEGDAALDATLAAADEGMLAAISRDLDLEGSLAQILQRLKNLAEPTTILPVSRAEPAEEGLDQAEEVGSGDPRSEFHVQVLAAGDEVAAAGDGDATLVLAVIETRRDCITLSRLVADDALAEMIAYAGRAMAGSAILLKSAWRRFELFRIAVAVVRSSKTVRGMAADITTIIVGTISQWNQISALLRQTDKIGMRLAEVYWRLGSLPEAAGILAGLTKALHSVGSAAQEASDLDAALERSHALALALGEGRTGHIRRIPDVGDGNFKLRRSRDLIEVLTGEINDVGVRLGKLAEALATCAESIPLNQLAAVQVDASGADLSMAHLQDLDVLAGVIWTHETIWPPGVENGVRERSREIRSGVFQICHGTERDPAKLAIV
jgi:hypothetical protein